MSEGYEAPEGDFEHELRDPPKVRHTHGYYRSYRQQRILFISTLNGLSGGRRCGRPNDVLEYIGLVFDEMESDERSRT